MAKNTAASAPITPADPTPAEPTASKPVPKRGTRKRVLGEGEGDYCIYEIAGTDTGLPKGALLPLPTIPRFEDTVSAIKWIRNESGDLLVGKQVMIFRACEILSLMVSSKPTITISTKPKVTVHQPGTGESSNG